MIVAITRPSYRARETEALLRARGYEPLIVPGVNLIPRRRDEVVAEIGDIADYDWLILTSSFAAELMHKYFADDLKKLKIAVVGKKTAETVKNLGFEVSLVPEKYRAENLVEALKKAGVSGKKLLFARASKARDVIVRSLRDIAEIRDVVLYYTSSDIPEEPVERLKKEIRLGKVKAVIFTSGESARNIIKKAGENFIQDLNKIKIIAIAPGTASVLEQAGVERVLIPREYTVEACLDLIGVEK